MQAALESEESVDDEGKSEDQDDSLGKAQKKKKQSKLDDKKQVTRGKMGVMLPEKNAFDFVVRPDKREDRGQEKKKDAESGKSKLQKTLLQLKRANTRPTSTKGMATVKLHY
jgi:hypothetical protein